MTDNPRPPADSDHKSSFANEHLPPPTDDPGPPDTSGPFRTELLNRIRRLIRTEADPDFDFHRIRPIPWTLPLADPSRMTVSLVSTSALHLREDPPFDVMQNRLGDTSYRVVPHGTPPRRLALDADYVDPKYMRDDPEVTLPMRALDRLAAAGRIAGPARRHYSICPGVVRPLPGICESAAAIAATMHEDEVGAIVLLPTCSLCVQTICLVAVELERRGLATVVISLLPELTEHVGTPRAMHVRFPFGAPCGDPGNTGLHEAVLGEALGWLAEAPEPGAALHCRLQWRRRY